MPDKIVTRFQRFKFVAKNEIKDISDDLKNFGCSKKLLRSVFFIGLGIVTFNFLIGKNEKILEEVLRVLRIFVVISIAEFYLKNKTHRPRSFIGVTLLMLLKGGLML